MLDHASNKPIYIQIAEWLENEVLSGRVEAGEKIYSQYQLADRFNINPATAAKGLKLLAEEEIVHKRRGLGMFVEEKAVNIIREKRKNKTLKRMLREIVKEANYLDVSMDELSEMLRRIHEEEGEEE
ncbi:GntR family transcriptional regulator [Allobacillus sp. GCM10007491]|uniref:GntR family transcriptional regulator n=1 Tax=Allobacillus saliphilus TaxID=2912308 RepID=A0A941CU31_9BACI|nr:GntR family transcriptional regulator [Allobacillus saliphilus]MBR7553967.1 GntR family transcriptional regulator [Allobacillus saliphilus]